MQVRFFQTDEKRLLNDFKLLEFNEAVQLTDELEAVYRSQKKKANASFEVISDEQICYSGIFKLGSYEFNNLYEQLKENVPRIRVQKQDVYVKDFLLDSIEKETDDVFKHREKIDATLINVEKTNISKLKNWQRKSIYGVTAASLLSSTLLLFTLSSQKNAYEEALKDGRNQVAVAQNYNNQYETALLGSKDALIVTLKEEKKLNNNQEKILVNELFAKDDFETAVNVLKSEEKVADLLLLSSIDSKIKKKKLKKFNDLYANNSSKFDIAYYEKNFELMLELKNVRMNTKRSEMLTLAYIRLDKIDEAKKELNNNNNNKLAKKIATIEGLKAEISVLEKKYKDVAKDKKRKKKAKQIKTKIEEKTNEIKTA